MSELLNLRGVDKDVPKRMHTYSISYGGGLNGWIVVNCRRGRDFAVQGIRQHVLIIAIKQWFRGKCSKQMTQRINARTRRLAHGDIDVVSTKVAANYLVTHIDHSRQ
jgi:hypothetical protein